MNISNFEELLAPMLEKSSGSVLQGEPNVNSWFDFESISLGIDSDPESQELWCFVPRGTCAVQTLEIAGNFLEKSETLNEMTLYLMRKQITYVFFLSEMCPCFVQKRWSCLRKWCYIIQAKNKSINQILLTNSFYVCMFLFVKWTICS